MKKRTNAGSTEHVWQLSPIGKVYERELKRVQITGARAPNMLHMFLSFSIVSGVIKWISVVLAALAASCHLAYDALCFVSIADGPHLLGVGWNKKNFLVPEPNLGGPAYWAEHGSEGSCEQKRT